MTSDANVLADAEGYGEPNSFSLTLSRKGNLLDEGEGAIPDSTKSRTHVGSILFLFRGVMFDFCFGGPYNNFPKIAI